jgi:hypothetical protein
MAVSTDLVQIGIVKESVYGTTPATPVFQVLPLTGESVAANVQTTESALMDPSRQTLDSILQNITAEGDLTTELAVTAALEILIESAFAEDLVAVSPAIPGKPDLKETMIGSTQNSFTIEKRFPDPASPGSYLYHRIPGCVVNTMTLSAEPSEAITVSFSVLGKELVTSDTLISGATYVEPTNPIVLRGPDTVTLDIDNAAVGAECFGAFGVTLNNNYRGIQCLGSIGNREMIIGKAGIDLTSTLQFSSNDLIDLLVAQTETTVDVIFNTAATVDPGAYFACHFPRVKLTSDSVVAGGTGEDVVEELGLRALYNAAGTDDTLGDNAADKTSMRVVLGQSALNS